MNPYRFWRDLQTTIQNSLTNPVRRCYQKLTKKSRRSLRYGHIFLGCVALFMINLCLPTEAYIEGPWLWMIASGEKVDDDQLAVASRGKLTENLVAEYGVSEGDTLGQLRWTRGRIRPTVDCLIRDWLCNSDNVNDVINEIGLSTDQRINYHSAYALINIVSSRDRKNVAMGVGSDDGVKVWLNGEVVHVNNVHRGTTGIQDLFRVDLRAGSNLLLVKVTDRFGHWGMFFEIYLKETDFTTELPIGTPGISLARQMFEKYSAILQQPEIQERVPTVLAHLQSPEIQPLLTPVMIDAVVKNPDILGAFGVDDEVIQFLKAHPSIRNMFSDPDFQTLLQNPEALSEFASLITDDRDVKIPKRQRQQPADADGNGVVNIHDLIFIASRFGQKGQSSADVNGDRNVDIRDLVLAAALMTTGTAAPSAFAGIGIERSSLPLRPEDIQLWLTQIQRVDLRDPTFQRGVIVLKHLMEMLTPKKTGLLPNYPNPFNPETWIPYQLSKSADVTLTIYSVNGTLVRTLALGYQPAGVYQNRSRAAYWDGRNMQGEPVASGVYFYTLTAGKFTATRKMLIRK